MRRYLLPILTVIVGFLLIFASTAGAAVRPANPANRTNYFKNDGCYVEVWTTASRTYVLMYSRTLSCQGFEIQGYYCNGIFSSWHWAYWPGQGAYRYVTGTPCLVYVETKSGSTGRCAGWKRYPTGTYITERYPTCPYIGGNH